MQAQKDIQTEANQHYSSRFDDEMRELLDIVADGTGERYEDALQQLQEMPLSFDKLITDHRRDMIQWELLLGTGGPADRVVVWTDERGVIESAEYQYQDWFEPWTAAAGQDEELVRRFAEIVGYYESE